MEQQVISVAEQVETAVSAALGRVRPELAGADPLVRRSDRADFQSNVALATAKRVKAGPAELAAELAQALRDADGIADVEVSGPGFLNITVAEPGLWRQAGRRAADDRLGVERSEQGARVVIDYSAPNIAKEMHVGHLRTTIIGDSLARVLGHLGATVIRQNHLGDWGTQFGMLIQYLDEHPELRAPIAQVVLPDDGGAEVPEHASERVADDRRAQVPDVHLLGDVRRRVVDDDAAALLGEVDSEPLAGQAQPELAPHGAVRGGDVEEAGTGDLDLRDRPVGAA